MTRLIGNIINIILMLLVLLMSGWIAYHDYEGVNELKVWHPATATVKSTSITRHPRSKGGWSYCPRVKVQYEFRGWQYTSNLIARCPPVKSAAMTANERFPKGLKVNIFINPKRPTEAKHESYSLGITFYGTLLLSCIGFFGIVYSIIDIVRSFKQSR